MNSREALIRIFCGPFIKYLPHPNYHRWMYLCVILLPLSYGLAAGVIGIIAIVSKFRFVRNIASPKNCVGRVNLIFSVNKTHSCAYGFCHL